MNEEYIKSVIRQIKYEMHEDQAFEIIKELIINRGKKHEEEWVTMGQTQQPYWNTDNSNKCNVEYETTITMLDLEELER